ncbi:MAG: YHS domain-containing protein [Acidobacteria bacterium]|nr:YHS domain-containing protein [Acidobacteriota bacterium]
MEGLLSFLLFAGLFYFMMRYGCGAHMVHGQGGHGEHAGHGGGGERQDGGGARDPVCGMNVAPGQGYTKMHEGREYRLCSRVCLDKFDAAPDRYASVEGGAR